MMFRNRILIVFLLSVGPVEKGVTMKMTLKQGLKSCRRPVANSAAGIQKAPPAITP
jgi:hypothetical protein